MANPARAVASVSPGGRSRPSQADMNDLWDELSRTNDKIDTVLEIIGKPGTPDSGQPASGIFSHINAHDIRLKTFEKLWEQVKGFGIGAAPLLAALWWLVGDKLAKLFH